MTVLEINTSMPRMLKLWARRLIAIGDLFEWNAKLQHDSNPRVEKQIRMLAYTNSPSTGSTCGHSSGGRACKSLLSIWYGSASAVLAQLLAIRPSSRRDGGVGEGEWGGVSPVVEVCFTRDHSVLQN